MTEKELQYEIGAWMICFVRCVCIVVAAWALSALLGAK